METGKMLAHYRVAEQIGKGGMGEVYRAHDTKLGRDVALKILPPEFAADPERLARFQSEAKVLASLHHPNIASIFGLENVDGCQFLVMELVEGEDLAEILKAGPLPVEDAVDVAHKIAEGLEEAHEHGIIHRDLKPANIKRTPDGKVKVLDFGLARALAGHSAAEQDVSSAMTMTAPVTQAGTVLGTAAYMSPEQARGREVDRRADIWAFGVILYEMLTGQRLFAGETPSDTMAGILKSEPEWDRLPPGVPFQVERVLRRCLAKDPRQRLRDIGEARVRLEDPDAESGMFSGPMAAVADSKRATGRWLPVALAFLILAVSATVWFFKLSGPEGPPRLPTHLALTLPEGIQVASRDRLPLGAPQPCLAISADGRLIVVVVERDDATWLYRKFLDSSEGALIEDSRGAYSPRISPDGQWISFMADNNLMRMAVNGDRATKLIELANSFGHDWINNDEIIINRQEATELLRLDVERGTFTAFAKESDKDEYFWPSHVPGTSLILMNSDSHVAKSEETDVDQVSLMDLDTNQRTRVGIGGSVPRMLDEGVLLLVRDGVLAAVDLDLNDPAATLRPTMVLENMLVEGWIGQYAVSQTGTMAYVPGEWLFGNELVWADGQGNQEPLGFPVLGYGDFELSPDGNMLAVTVGGGRDVQSWIYDLERGGRRLLNTEGSAASAIWSPDGQRLAFATSIADSHAIMIQALGASEATILVSGRASWVAPYAWHDEAGIFYNFSKDIYRIDPDGPGEPELLVGSEATEWGPDISPDGRWFAYTSDESGRYEIYMRALGGNRSWTVSLDGGEEPIFSADGKTIYYRYGNRFFATPILEASADGQRFRAGQPRVVVEGPYSNVPGISYDVGPDGRLLLLRSDGGTERPGHINVILNWDVELAERLAQ